MSTKAEKLKAAARTPRPPPPASSASMDDFVRGTSSEAEKRGRGRPKREQEREPVTVHLAPELAKRLRIAKIEEGREMSEIVADALAVYLKAQ